MQGTEVGVTDKNEHEGAYIHSFGTHVIWSLGKKTLEQNNGNTFYHVFW